MTSLLTPDKFLWLLFLVVPGFVAKCVYSLRCPTHKQDWEKALIELIGYSLVNLIPWFWLVFPVTQTPVEHLDAGWVSFVGVVVCLVSPAGLALAWHSLRAGYLHRAWGLDHPTAKAWDYFILNNNHFFVLFHLKNNKTIGGYFSSCSYATTYPQDPEIYVEQVWRVDEFGRFVEEVPGSAGAVVRHTDWELVEFFKIQREGTDESAGTEGHPGREQTTALGNGRSPGSGATGAVAACGSREDRPPARGVGDCPTADPAQEVKVNHVHGAE